MRWLCVVALGAAALLSSGAGCSGCRDEPTIVIKFEPQDLSGVSGVAPKSTAAAPTVAVDAGTATATAAAAKSLAPTAAEVGPCKSDADCAAAPAECCDCSAGGTQVAVLKKAVKTRAARCGDMMCTQMMSTDPSCSQVAACVKGTCTLVAPPTGGAAKKKGK